MSNWCQAIDDVDELLHVCRMCHKCSKCHGCYKPRKSSCHRGHRSHMDRCAPDCGCGRCYRPCAPLARPCNSYGQVIYYDAFTSQTINSGANVKFNITGPKSADIVHSDSISNDVITLAQKGVYKLEYTLTLDPQADTSAPPDDHVFAIVANGITNVPSKSGNGQHNSIATYQIHGATLLTVDSDNTAITLRNVGATATTLAKSLDTTTVVGAYLLITKL